MGRQHFFIPWDRRNLSASLDVPEGAWSKLPLIIICHGFIGSKTGVNRLFVKAAEEFNKAGAAVLRFDYTGCGESEGEYGHTRFEEILSQTRTVVDYACSLDFADSENIFLLGHSLGGAAAAINASRDERIRKLLLWSAVGNPYQDITEILGSERVSRLQAGQAVDYAGFEFTRKYIDSLKGYLTGHALNDYNGSALLIHGSEDKEIPCSYSIEFNKKNKNCSLHIVKGACHTYSTEKHFRELMQASLQWFNKELQ
ncbi:alpha/beta hydrolase [Peribacillus kribbensis]|uniref:alpha/beta hydrolase n=1 Tax=Peribacillus kribbensis TaxID=356658 RepID=UPI00041E075F|nr:alpha/beta fold hydrolase [Peribacillus kribbensis]